MTSLEIAEVTRKLHSDVMQVIRNMEPAWVKITQGNFSLSEYRDPRGRSLPCYSLTKTGVNITIVDYSNMKCSEKSGR